MDDPYYFHQGPAQIADTFCPVECFYEKKQCFQN